MSVLLEFAMFPTDKGESVSPYVSKVVKYISEAALSYQLTPMGTIAEFETFEGATELLNKCYAVLEPDCNRVYCSAKFDVRKGSTGKMESKIKSIEQKIGTVNK